MELTEGILKAIDSSVIVLDKFKLRDTYGVFYKGNRVQVDGDKKVYYTANAAKKAVYKLVFLTFWQGQYWQSCKTQIKGRSGVDVDFSATIAILPQYGTTGRFKDPETIKMFKALRDELLKKEIFTIVKF
jgi:hypothetical protein